MSECGIGSASSGSFSSSMASRRHCWAMSGCRLTSQATISLDPMSHTGAGYALPSATLNSVTSVPSFTHGRSAVKSRFSRFSALAPVSPPVRAVFPVRVRPAYPAFQAHAPHDLQHALVAHPHPELVHEAHAYLPVAAPVGRAREYLGDHRLDVRPGHGGRMRQKMVIRAFRQSGRPELFCFNVCSTGSAVFFRSVG